MTAPATSTTGDESKRGHVRRTRTRTIDQQGQPYVYMCTCIYMCKPCTHMHTCMHMHIPYTYRVNM